MDACAPTKPHVTSSHGCVGFARRELDLRPAVRSNRFESPLSATMLIAVGRTHQLPVDLVIAAAQRGDAAAQAEIFEQHRGRVARQILRMTGDATTVDDLVQEVFISAFTALGSFRSDAQLDTWLYTIATNKVRNWWDARRRRAAREHAATVVEREPPPTPEEGLESDEHLRRFYAALGGLPDKLREAFTARAIEHLSLADAAAVLGVPVSTVSYRTRRAETLLCEALGLPAPFSRDGEREP